MPPSNLRSAIEALLFSSDQPLSLALMADALDTPLEEMADTLRSLGEEYTGREAGVQLREMAGGWVFMTTPEQHEWVTRMLRGKRKARLSRAALETLAIIAYKQPVTKSEAEAIRGVDCSGTLATLLERNLVTIKGRSTVVGRPLLYGSTQDFLNYFGLRDLAELPRPEELRALVAAREPEQLEMLEMDPGSGMPLQLAPGMIEGDAALEGGGVAEFDTDAEPAELAVTDEVDNVSVHQERDEFLEAAIAMATDMPESSDHAPLPGGDDEDDADGAADEDEDDDDDDDDDEDDWDDDVDEDDEDDDEDDEDEDDEHPSAQLTKQETDGR
ncbi:MAG: SMC-Scp complex subunit ScpB [Candidatus Eisenbacteria bacterium]